jgi:hypothetical protein
MAERPDYAELVAKAEKAVIAVKDPELKRIAFQKILDDLLTSDSRRAEHKKRSVGKKGRSSSPTTPNRRGPQAYVEQMIEDGFFKKPKTIAQVKAELENRGHHIALTSLSGPLQKLCQRRSLRRQKATLSGNKETFAYSEW